MKCPCEFKCSYTDKKKKNTACHYLFETELPKWTCGHKVGKIEDLKQPPCLPANNNI